MYTYTKIIMKCLLSFDFNFLAIHINMQLTVVKKWISIKKVWTSTISLIFHVQFSINPLQYAANCSKQVDFHGQLVETVL